MAFTVIGVLSLLVLVLFALVIDWAKRISKNDHTYHD